MKQVEGRGQERRNHVFCDIDSDGQSESFYIKRYKNFDIVEWYNNNAQFVDVLRVNGFLLESGNSYYFTDLDEDGFLELYLWKYRNDSLFLDGNELLGDDGYFLKDFYLDNDGIQIADESISIDVKVADMKKDGSSELVFNLLAGYSLTPRRMMSIDPFKRILNKSKNTGGGFYHFQIAEGLDRENRSILAIANAIENFDKEDTILFNDNSGWIVHYNYDLSDILFSKEYDRNKPRIQACVWESDDRKFIYSLVNETRIGKSNIEKLDNRGILLKRVELKTEAMNDIFMNAYSPYLSKLVIYSQGRFKIFDDDLRIKRIIDNAGNVFSLAAFEGQYFNEQTKCILCYDNNSLMLRDSSLRLLARSDYTGLQNFNGIYPGVYHQISKEEFTIGISTANGSQFFKVRKNPFFSLRYFIYAMAFIVVYVIFYFLFRLQEYLYNRRAKTQQEIKSLQLQTVQNQLQPHFTFNVLNTVGSMIYQNEKETAYKYLNHFADMLRSILLSKSSHDWCLRDELNFVETYIEMENLRFDNKFQYALELETEINKLSLIPKLTIQAYVENAIRHGLMHKDKDCRLWLSVKQDDKHLIITIEDNGIGREASEKIQRNHIGLGNDILLEYFDTYNKSKKVKFELEIIDLVEGNNPKGTKVMYKMPRNYKMINSSQ